MPAAPTTPVFSFTHESIDVMALRAGLQDPAAGGYAAFEGLVRNHNEGLPVRHLEYEAFEPLAIKEGERIVAEALAKFGVEHAACVHRVGDLAIGEMAVWVGVSARHRAEAFQACRYIIDAVKHRVPIWKKEHYENGDSGWVNCERCHAHTPAPASTPAAVLPDYSRQMALKEVGAKGQAALHASRVLVVGCGGLGVPVISYLAGAGVGTLGLVDGDRLEPSNLHRQTLYALADSGQLKAQLAAARVGALNPEVNVRAYPVRVGPDNAAQLVAQYDLVIDCTDNFATKFMLNDVCVQLAKPAVFASVYQFEGQLQVIRPDRNGACLRCVWPEATRDGIVGNCSEAGVLGPVPGVFGSLQAFEALKLLLDLPGQLTDELLVFDLLTASTSRVRTRRSAACPDHARRALATEPPEDLELAYPSLDAVHEAGFDVIDIREARELAESPAPGIARHVPMSQLLHGEPAFAPRTRSVLVCASGRRSLAAAAELRARGIRGVYSLRGGVAALRSTLPV